MGTRRRAAAAGRESQRGSRGLPAATQILLCTLGLGSDRVGGQARGHQGGCEELPGEWPHAPWW